MVSNDVYAAADELIQRIERVATAFCGGDSSQRASFYDVISRTAAEGAVQRDSRGRLISLDPVRARVANHFLYMSDREAGRGFTG